MIAPVQASVSYSVVVDYNTNAPASFFLNYFFAPLTERPWAAGSVATVR
jgi:hypothetical protein